MIAKKLMKKPMIPFLILLVIIGLYEFNAKKNKNWSGVIPTSCKSAIVRLKRQAPKDWNIDCQINKMLINIKEVDSSKKMLDQQKYLYNRLANYIVFTSNNSFIDSLENVEMISFKLDSPTLEINAYIRGKSLAKISKIKSKKILASKLKEWVKIRETKKN